MGDSELWGVFPDRELFLCCETLSDNDKGCYVSFTSSAGRRLPWENTEVLRSERWSLVCDSHLRKTRHLRNRRGGNAQDLWEQGMHECFCELDVDPRESTQVLSRVGCMICGIHYKIKTWTLSLKSRIFFPFLLQSFSIPFVVGRMKIPLKKKKKFIS